MRGMVVLTVPMARSAAALALALFLAGCSSERGEQVPLATSEPGVCCVLLYSVADVVADPTTGTPIDKATGRPFKWPAGYTAWRAGTETEVLDASGNVVLRTGGRYYMSPNSTYPWDVIGEVRPCPHCELRGGPL